MAQETERGPLIWIVDNNRQNAEQLQSCLQKNACEVSVFSDGFQCLDCLENIKPDLIIIELALPDLNGIETIRSIRAKIPDQEIIAIAEQSPNDYQQHFFDSDRISFILKPLKPEQINLHLTKSINLTLPNDSQSQQSKANKILIAEDNEINCLLLENQLLSLNCSVDIATDGGQAVDKLLETTYDLALIDLNMPIMDGLEVMKTIRGQCGPNQQLKMIAVSGFAEKRLEKAALRNGFDNFITKPVDVKELEEILQPGP